LIWQIWDLEMTVLWRTMPAGRLLARLDSYFLSENPCQAAAFL